MDDKDNRETICKADRKCFPIFAFCKTNFSKDIRGNDLASRAVVVPQREVVFLKTEVDLWKVCPTHCKAASY